MPRRLTTAPEALFWYWVSERHRIYLARAAGAPKPWTDDPILRDYKFTNVFRQLDRGTVWLTDNFIKPHKDGDLGLLAFNVAWYRMFNWTGTGALLGWRESWNKPAINQKLRRASSGGAQIFTGSHIVWGGGGGVSKIEAVVDHCGELWRMRRRIVSTARFNRTKRSVFDSLLEVRGVGDFIAGEIISDYCYTPILQGALDLNTWLPLGPGAWRGLQRLQPELRKKEALAAMLGLLSRSEDARGAHVPPLTLRDVAMSLCEFDKYVRVKTGEGKPRSKYDGR